MFLKTVSRLLQRRRWPVRGLRRHRRQHRAVRGGRRVRRVRLPQEDEGTEEGAGGDTGGFKLLPLLYYTS